MAQCLSGQYFWHNLRQAQLLLLLLWITEAGSAKENTEAGVVEAEDDDTKEPGRAG